MTKVLITGAAGMMGSHLSDMLRADDYEVLPTFYKPTIDSSDLKQLNAVEMDITDWCSVYDTMSAFIPDVVVHLAAQSYPTVSWQRPIETLQTNVIGTAIVFEAIRRACPKASIVSAGSSAEYGLATAEEIPVRETKSLRPLHPYGVSKVATDLLAYQYFKSYGMNAVTARIFNCTGPRKTGDAASDFVRRCVWLERNPGNNTLRVGNLESQRTLIDVRDLNRALILLFKQGRAGTAYNVGGNAIYTMQEIVDLVLAESNLKDVKLEVDPSLLRPTDENIIFGDCTILREETGWTQQIPLEQTIADMFAYWRNKQDDALTS